MNAPLDPSRRLAGRHLTDEQFGSLLAGESLDRAAEAHLHACPRCRGEAEAVGESLRAFHQVSLVWAQEQAPRRVPVPSRWTLRLGARPVWNVGLMTAATAVVLAMGLRVPPPHTSTPTLNPLLSPALHPALRAGVTHADPTGAELAADNRLLVSIQKELDYSAQPAVPVAELKPGVGQTGGHPAEAFAN